MNRRSLALPRLANFDRLNLLAVLTVFTGLLLLGRLFHQTILKHDSYLAEASKQQSATYEIQAQRGIIYATDTEQAAPVILAESVVRYAVSATPRYVTDPERLINIFVERLADVDAAALRERLTYNGTTEWPDGLGFYTPPIKHGLTIDEVRELAAVLDPSLAVQFDTARGDIIYFSEGVFFVREYQRVYPEKTLAAHVLGYVNFEGDGQYGFEQANSRHLMGSAGNVAVERDSRGRLLGQVGSVAGRNGDSFVLTIDRNVQYEAERVLGETVQKHGADSGSVVVLAAKTGAVLALANAPTFNPNEFDKVPADQLSVFRNAAIASRYEFGSVFKPFTVAAALDKGLTTPDERADYPGSLTIGQYTVKNVETKAYPNITTTQALEFSVNTAMVTLADRLGSPTFHDYLKRLGFGQETGIELFGETAGFLLPLGKMRDIQRATISFGQGIDTTPLQLAAAYTALAGDGTLLQPKIIDKVIYPDGSEQKTEVKEVAQIFKPETAAAIRNMMVSVVISGHARLAQVRGYKIAGKTGTAQIPHPDGGYYPDHFRHSFIALFPADEPEFIAFMTLENPRSAPFAESTAAPATGEIAKFLLHYYQIPPTNQ